MKKLHSSPSKITMKCIAIFLLCLTLTNTSLQSQWHTNQDASVVIGQNNFTLNDGYASRQGLNSPSKIAIDFKNNKLYVADNANNRVVRYSYPITENNPTAEILFGQVDFSVPTPNHSGSVTASTMFGPTGIVVHNGTLWVADANNNRVLRFTDAHLYTENGPEADAVLGQPDFTSKNAVVSRTGMRSPATVAFDSSGNLYVADAGSSRVLRFENAALKNNGAEADGVLGQADFTGSAPMNSRTGMYSCNGLAIDKAGRLYVADNRYNRVLRYDNAALKPNGAPADGVLGQPNYTAYAAITSQTGLSGATDVAIDAGGRLYVADVNSNRILIYNNAANKPNGGEADIVLGQQDFISSLHGVAQNKLDSPYGLALDNQRGFLFVADYVNNRVLQFNSEGGIDLATGIDDVFFTGINEAYLSVYPIPAKDIITIHWPNIKIGIQEISLYSQLGQMIMTIHNQDIENTGNISIPTAELPSGSYTFLIKHSRGIDTKPFRILR